MLSMKCILSLKIFVDIVTFIFVSYIMNVPNASFFFSIVGQNTQRDHTVYVTDKKNKMISITVG